MTRREHDLAGGSTVTTDAYFDRTERNRSPAFRAIAEYQRTILTSDVVTGLPDAVVPTSIACDTAFADSGNASATGAEPTAEWRPSPGWRVQASYRCADIEIRRDTACGSVSQSSLSDGTSPLHQASLRISGDLAERIQPDMAARCVDTLKTFATPDCTAVDARLGWRLAAKLDLSPTGRNPCDGRHAEFGMDPLFSPADVRRSFMLRAAPEF